VDLTDPARTLTIQDVHDEKGMMEALQKVGYKAEKV
jgi:hypothetical protein